MRKICRTILAAGLMACMMRPAVNVMATDDIVGNWQADEAGVGFAKISASLAVTFLLIVDKNPDGACFNILPPKRFLRLNLRMLCFLPVLLVTADSLSCLSVFEDFFCKPL